MINILITESNNYSKEALKILEKIGKVSQKNLDYKKLIKEISIYDVIIVKLGIKFDERIISSFVR